MTKKVEIANTSNWKGENIDVTFVEGGVTVTATLIPGEVRVFWPEQKIIGIEHYPADKIEPFKDRYGRQYFPQCEMKYVYDDGTPVEPD